MAGIYFATLKVEYVWRWYRVPQYFYYKDTIETRAEIEGEVASLVTRGNQVEVTVRGDGEEEIYTVPAHSVRVKEGDFVYAGDVLGSYQKWKVGILVEGLWVTLKVSIIAVLLGNPYRPFHRIGQDFQKSRPEVDGDHLHRTHKRLTPAGADLYLVFCTGHRDQ